MDGRAILARAGDETARALRHLSQYTLPLRSSLERKWSAIRQVVDFRVVASSPDRSTGDETFDCGVARRSMTAILALATVATRREVRRFGRMRSSPRARASRRSVAAHRRAGDRGAPRRLETCAAGVASRCRLARVADSIGDQAVREAAKVRAVSPYTAQLAEPPARAGRRVSCVQDMARFRRQSCRCGAAVVLFIGCSSLREHRRAG